jgi:DMSO/TMAO reductase YedYZ molybdopterin-dependent catalytic subunit
MANRERHPGFWYGALAGAMLTAPMMAIFYLANRLVGTPFIPFDFFEWQTRVLPGNLVASGISLMVKLLTYFKLSVRETSKPAEITMALVQFLILGTVVGGCIFLFWKRFESMKRNILSGIILGGSFGLFFLSISFVAGDATAPAALNVYWVILIFLIWGISYEWIYIRLDKREIKTSRLEVEPRAQVEVNRYGRRKFLITLGGTSAAITVISVGLESLLQEGPSTQIVSAQSGGIDLFQPTPEVVTLPARPDAIIPVPGTRPEYTPVEKHYRIDINLDPPKIDGSTWQLPITGLVDQPLTLNLNDFYENKLGDPLHLFITLACISNELGGDLVGTTRWTGISVQNVLDRVNPKPEAKYLLITSKDGFHESVPLDLIRSEERVMLTYLWDGEPLPVKHGYPLRIYVPDRYGMKQPKWIVGLEFSADDREGYWVQRGWDKIAQMKATSVIDVVDLDQVIERDGQQYIPIGGIARAGARGISKVEIKVDDGDWQEAQLRTPLSDLTWVLWRYEWPFQAGEHTFAVVCYDGEGNRQITIPSPPDPSGATGIYKVTKNI